jgi:hypothetical protein
MNIRYRVTLTVDERLDLETLIQKGKISARRIKRAQAQSPARHRRQEGPDGPWNCSQTRWFA